MYMSRRIITISREFGSGGRTIAKLVADKLGYEYYDKDLIEKIAEGTGFSKGFIERYGEQAPGNSLFSYAFLGRTVNGMAMQDYIWMEQRKIILDLAEKGNCVIVGRCADYVLGDYTNCINTFIYAYKEDRIRRIMKLYKLDEKQAADKIRKTDRDRKNYYEARTKRQWGGIDANSMMFNASLLGIDGVVDALEAIYRKWEIRE